MTATQPGSAYREVPEGLDIDGVICIKEIWRVAKDNTVRYRGRTLQLYPESDRPSYAQTHVEVKERLDGRLLVRYRGQLLTPEDAPFLAAELLARAEAGFADADIPVPLPEQRTVTRKSRTGLCWDGD